jgi:hypothetical protein
VDILGIDETSKLLSVIDKEQLPERYGGRLRDGYMPPPPPSPTKGSKMRRGEGKYEAFAEEDDSKYSEGKEESRPAEAPPGRRMSAVNGLKTLSRRMSQKSLFTF